MDGLYSNMNTQFTYRKNTNHVNNISPRDLQLYHGLNLWYAFLLTIPCYSAIGAENNPLIDISREVNIQLRGITSILDTITIKAPVGESTTIQSLWIGNLDLYNPELVQFEMKQGNSWIPLTFESETRLDYNGYLVEFPSLQTISDLENIVIQAKFTHIDLISVPRTGRSRLA